MYRSFYIKETRLDELKTYIRVFTPTVRFYHNPLKVRNEWFIALTMKVEDSNKLNELFEKLDNEDESLEKSKINKEIGPIKKIFCKIKEFFNYIFF